jgi:hypothetical protein
MRRPFFRDASSSTVASSSHVSFGNTRPVGLDGEFTITIRVRGVIARAIASTSSEKSVGSRSAGAGTRPVAYSIGS